MRTGADITGLWSYGMPFPHLYIGGAERYPGTQSLGEGTGGNRILKCIGSFRHLCGSWRSAFGREAKSGFRERKWIYLCRSVRSGGLPQGTYRDRRSRSRRSGLDLYPRTANVGESGFDPVCRKPRPERTYLMREGRRYGAKLGGYESGRTVCVDERVLW